MKKIIIAITALSSALTFAGEFSKANHRIEAGIQGAVQFGKNIENNAFQKYTYIGAAYTPEWDYNINDKISLTFGPRVSLGVETNISVRPNNKVKDQAEVKPAETSENGGGQAGSSSVQNQENVSSEKKEDSEGTSNGNTTTTSPTPKNDKEEVVKSPATPIDNAYGLKGGIGGQFEVNFRIPDSEVIYLGVDTNLYGLGYVGKNLGNENSKAGFAYDLGLSLGGKIGDKVKLGGRIGYEFEGLFSKDNDGKYKKEIEQNHNLTLGIRFGYIIQK